MAAEAMGTRAMTKLPATVIDEQRAIERVSIWVATLGPRLTKKYSREWLETELVSGLREGRLSLAEKAVEAADKKNDEIADSALREVGAELQTALVQGRVLAPGHLQIVAYFQRAARRAPHKRPRGQRWYDNWVRNINICILVALACVEFGVRPTRNRAARRANKEASGTSLVVAALGRNGIHLDEGSLQENLWFGLPGELVRGILAHRLPWWDYVIRTAT
jgi:hypothetical protein